MFTESYHTSIVRSARVILPVAALGLLSTLFLLARTVNPDDAIPFADVDVSERARDQQLTSPRFVGVSTDGTEYDLVADRALPDATDPRRMTAEAVHLALNDPEGGSATIEAATADVDTAERRIVMREDVVIITSTGYRLTAPLLEGSLGQLNIRASGGVNGRGPLGTLRAESVFLNEGEDGAQRMVFTGGVDLLYTPPEE